MPQPLKFQVIHQPGDSGLSTRYPGIKIQFAMKKKIFLSAAILARLPVALCVGTYRSGKDSRRQKDFLSHCDLFLMPGGGWEVRLSRLVNNLKF